MAGRTEITIKGRKALMAKLFGRIREVEAAVYFETILTANATMKSLVSLSPVWSGSYVKSHRVGINFKDPRHAPVHHIVHVALNNWYFPVSKMSSAMATRLRNKVAEVREKNLSAAKPGDKIIISNSIDYAPTVEYIGWEKTGPYHVYAKTKIRVKNQRKQIRRIAKMFAKNLRKAGTFKKRKVTAADMQNVLLSNPTNLAPSAFKMTKITKHKSDETFKTGTGTGNKTPVFVGTIG